MKIPEFLQVSEKVREILYGDNVCCREHETLYYDEYLLDNPQNETALDKIVSSKGIQLVVAQPGAGKSVSLLKSLNKLVDADDSYFVVAVFPTRGLGEQMAFEDGVDQLLGGDEEETFNLYKTFCSTGSTKPEKIRGRLAVMVRSFCTYHEIEIPEELKEMVEEVEEGIRASEEIENPETIEEEQTPLVEEENPVSDEGVVEPEEQSSDNAEE